MSSSSDLRMRQPSPSQASLGAAPVVGNSAHSGSGMSAQQHHTPQHTTHRSNRNLLFGGNAGAGAGGGSASKYPQPPNYNHSTQEMEGLERDNNAQVDNLNDKVSVMKDVAIQISDEVDYQNRMLDKMSLTFDSAQGLLGGTMERLNDMINSGNGGKHMWYLIAFLVFFFVALYLLFRH
ncbi:Bet1-like SNARE 1-2 [Porphyridium purpureum]|uniref:Bet1-like SNARE 1-2 n=1 Tax=Porphyridium purpureum TaxID=35688 RepID=A0A5J4Z1W4_PORPP|nr:Bet1-like SNARE 1-2 [Porphyridium purpureum]|eukprot:POR5813..scf208_2